MSPTAKDLPGLDCGQCGFRTCAALAERVATDPGLLKRCIYLSEDCRGTKGWEPKGKECLAASCQACADVRLTGDPETAAWCDHLGREFDFYLERFPEEPGPREIILPHNPLLTREMGIEPGDVLIGRPLGVSCGCPITHCGVAMQVDSRTGVIVWCVTGPLGPRQGGYKDLGYYVAEGYEGLIRQKRCEVTIGMRYFFLPRLCVMQWRHSGLVNYLNRTPDGLQVRVEGLWIG